MKTKKLPNKINGSALVWAVAVIAILMITVLATVTVALGYASSAARRNVKNQAYYTAMSGLDIVIDWLCDGEKYIDGQTQHPVIDVMAIGSEYEYTLDLASPSADGMSYMGDCTAVIERLDEKTVTVTVTADIPEVASRSVSAVLQRKSTITPGAGAALFLRSDKLTMERSSVLTAMKNTSIISTSNFEFRGDKTTLPTITVEENGMLYLSNIQNHINNKQVNIPETVRISSLFSTFDSPTVSYTLPGNEVEWTTLNNINKFESDKYYYVVSRNAANNSGHTFQLANGADYVFTARDNNTDFPLRISLANPTDKANVYLITGGGSSFNVELFEAPENVNIFICSENSNVIFMESMDFTGFIYSKVVTVPSGAAVNLHAAAPEKHITVTYPDTMASSGGSASHEWIFSKYQSASLAD